MEKPNKTTVIILSNSNVDNNNIGADIVSSSLEELTSNSKEIEKEKDNNDVIMGDKSEIITTNEKKKVHVRRPTHFIALRIDDTNVVHNIGQFQKAVLKKAKFLKPCAIKLSLLVLSLENSSDIQLATEAIQKAIDVFNYNDTIMNNCNDITKNSANDTSTIETPTNDSDSTIKTPWRLTFDSIGMFGQDVLFATMSSDEQQKSLQILYSILLKYLQEQNLCIIVGKPPKVADDPSNVSTQKDETSDVTLKIDQNKQRRFKECVKIKKKEEKTNQLNWIENNHTVSIDPQALQDITKKSLSQEIKDLVPPLEPLRVQDGFIKDDGGQENNNSYNSLITSNDDVTNDNFKKQYKEEEFNNGDMENQQTNRIEKNIGIESILQCTKNLISNNSYLKKKYSKDQKKIKSTDDEQKIKEEKTEKEEEEDEKEEDEEGAEEDTDDIEISNPLQEIYEWKSVHKHHNEPYRPHMTIMKTSQGRMKCKKQRKSRFKLKRGIIHSVAKKTAVFGTQDVISIDFVEMMTQDSDGYYHRVATYPINTKLLQY